MKEGVRQGEEESQYFQTTEEAVDHLREMVPADIWRREFQGSYWDLIESKSPHSLDELVQSVLGDSTVRALIGTYLTDCVVPNLESMIDEGATYDPDTSDLIELDGPALAEIEALIPQLIRFAQDLQSANGAPMRIVDGHGDSVEREDMKVIAEIAGRQRIMRFKVQAVMIGETLCFSGVQNENTFVFGMANPYSGDGKINIIDHPPLNPGEFMHVIWFSDPEAGSIDTSIERQSAVDEQAEKLKGLLVAHIFPDVGLGIFHQSADGGIPVASTLWRDQGDENGWQGVTIGPEKIVMRYLQ